MAKIEPCQNFTLDYYESGHQHRPEWRYCKCGWTEAHHEKGRR